MRFVVAPGVEPDEHVRSALEAAHSAFRHAVLFAAVVPGDEAWPRVLDKEEAIEACRHGLVALRAVQPGALLTSLDLPDFAATAEALASGRGYLVPSARATRRGPAPKVPRVRLLAAGHFTREERLWQLFRLFS
jgi:hypothetical protein